MIKNIFSIDTFRRLARLWLLLLIAAAAKPASIAAQSPLPLVGGKLEPDYLYPWIVDVSSLLSCGGVILSPKWILTSAHCLGPQGGGVFVDRTDPSGVRHYQNRGFDRSDYILHPQYVFGESYHDIALIRLRQPLEILPSAQTVGLPPDPRQPGIIGTVASGTYGDRQGIFRAAVPDFDSASYFEIVTNAATGALCRGDSGSGFVTVERGRAIVRGVASLTTDSLGECSADGTTRPDFTDVFHHRDWILQTMRVTDYFLDGNTRIRSAGWLASGVMGIGCGGGPTVWGPLYVRGAQEGRFCDFDDRQAVICWLDRGQPHLAISHFSMRTTFDDGTVAIQKLPSSARFATYYGILPYGAYREFTCTINLAIVVDAIERGLLIRQ